MPLFTRIQAATKLLHEEDNSRVACL